MIVLINVVIVLVISAQIATPGFLKKGNLKNR